MKLHDSGLWFKQDGEWSNTIPEEVVFSIHYDGANLGGQFSRFDLLIYKDKPNIIVLKSKLPFKESWLRIYELGRPLTLDDFEIMENPDYRGSP